MDDEERADIIRKAYAILNKRQEQEERWAAEAAARDPYAPDPLEEWQRLRERSQPPDPKPQRWPKLDTARGQGARDEYVDDRARRCIGIAFGLNEDMLPSLAHEKGLLKDVLAMVIADLRREWKREIAAEVQILQCRLDEAQAEIKKLREMKTQSVRWHVDPTHFRVFPFVNGQLAPALNLRPLFERFVIETS